MKTRDRERNGADDGRATRAIEEAFPIVEINRLAVPERNAFKPIYQMHKWFARRASSVFRAILLGCLKPAGVNVMDEFYRDHSDDPDTKDKVVLDPFMGGGTTVVEALRLGCRVIGVDLNPVAWFIVKTETTPVDPEDLRAAFERLADRRVEWSGKSLRETLLDQYKTTCPCCHGEAETVYTFWVKSAICHNEACPGRSHGKGLAVPLFSDYVVASKKPSIRFWKDVRCPKCKQKFDWETEPATLIGEPSLMVNDSRTSAGELRGNVRWSFGSSGSVRCPWCEETVNPFPDRKPKAEKKKVPLTVLLCPHCESVWQMRGDCPDDVQCPVCRENYRVHGGNSLERGAYVCPSCGTQQSVIDSLRGLPEGEIAQVRPYGIEGFCPKCAGAAGDVVDTGDLFVETPNPRRVVPETRPHACLLSKNGGKFFARFGPADRDRYQRACVVWEKEKCHLPHPHQEIPVGEKTKSGLLSHHYRSWSQMFNSRQLLCVSTLLQGISLEEDNALQECLLGTFQYFLERQNLFTRYFNDRNTVQGSFDRHDFQPKSTPAENAAWGLAEWRGTFPNMFERTLEGVRFYSTPYDLRRDGGPDRTVLSKESLGNGSVVLRCGSSLSLDGVPDGSVDMAVTDPPYVGNVNYAELSDFFYVWLRLILSERYPQFAPEFTPKADEVIENRTRGKTRDDFQRDLTGVFSECRRVLKSSGLLVFTFHHAENAMWEVVLRAVMDAGFELHRAYPIHGEKETSTQLQTTEGISYDLIHVCRKREQSVNEEARAWAGVRQEIRRGAREEVRAIEAGRYGNEPLSPADVNIILIGKCLELYSRHYGSVLGYDDRPVELHDALKDIRSMVDDLVAREHPLPSVLEDVDAESRIYLLTLCAFAREIKSDDLHKVTRGILEPDDLLESGLIIKGRAKRGRTYEVRLPAERYDELKARFGVEQPPQTDLFGEDLQPRAWRRTLFIDRIHFLIGLVEAGENVRPWLERFRGQTPQIRAACEHLRQRQARFATACDKILRFLEVDPLFRGKA